MPVDSDFKKLVRAAIAATPIPSLLATREAIVLERIARGGGATNWFFCWDQSQLEKVEEELRPGSAVSFYFDKRIQRARPSSIVEDEILQTLARAGEIVV